jgi:hypothetical protein
MTDTPAARPRAWQRRDWRAVASGWGPPGNERLTSSIGLVLLVLLAVETLTTLSLHTYLALHIFLGLLLLPPVALKLASTGWRFLRYYMGNRRYRLAGPPRLLLRLLAPLLVASTVSLFASGVALIVVGHGGGPLLRLHVISFLVWGVLMIFHVVVYVARALRAGTADWSRRGVVVAGTQSRRVAIVGALLAGVVVAVATYPAQQAWLNHRHRDQQGHAAGVAQGAAGRQLASYRTNGEAFGKREDAAS